jgi:phage-related protein
VGSVDFELLLNSNPFNKGLKDTTNTIKSSGIENSLKKIGKLAVAAFSVKAIVNFGKECINLGSDLTEVQNVVDVTFGSLNTEVNRFAENAITQFGLGQTVTKKYVGTFGAMAKAFNFSNKEALAMSETLTGLTGDVASFYNLSSDEAYTKLKSVFTGETETLKDLGVVMTQNALDRYALANGYGKTTSKMSEQEKVALRYKFVLDKLNIANGDFARTSDSWANQTRVLSLRFNELKAALGQGFINIFTPIVKGINWVLSKLQVLANAFKSFTEMIFGNAGGDDSTSTVSNLASDASDASDAVSGIGDSAKKSAKDLKSLASFDTAQILKKDDSKSKSSSGSGAGGKIDTSGLNLTDNIKKQASNIEDILNGVNLEPLKKSFNNLREAISYFGQGCGKILDSFYNNYLKPLGNYVISDALPHFLNSTANAMKSINFDKLKNSFDNLWKSLEPFTENVGNGLLWFYDNVLLKLAAWTINDVLPAFLDLIAGALKILNQVITAFEPVFQWFWNNFLEPIAKWTGGVIVDTLNLIASALSKIGDWMGNNQETVAGMEIAILSFFGAWKTVELMSFIAQSGGVINALKNITLAITGATVAKIKDKTETMYLNLLYAKDFVKNIISGTAALIKQAVQWVVNTGAKIANTAATIASTAATTAATAATWLFNAALTVLTSPITLVVIAVAALIAIIVALIKNWDNVKETAKKCWEGIKNAWNKAGQWFNEKIVIPIKNFFGNLWNNIKNTASGAWQGIKEVFSGIGNWFSDKFQSARNGIQNAFQNIGNWFQDRKNDITNAFGNVGNWFSNIFQEAYNGITRIFSNIGNFFSGIWERVKNAFSNLGINIGNAISDSVKSGINGVIGLIEKTINKAIKLINGAIGIINLIPGVNISKINRLSLPRLAQGGYVKANTPQLAMIGDNRHQGEVVAPEDKIMSLYKKANQEMGLGNNKKVIELLEKIIQILVNLSFDFNLYIDAYELNKKLEKIRSKNKFATNGG